MTEEEARARLRLLELDAHQGPPQVIEEMSPDVSKWDRFVAKNLATKGSDQLDYLAGKYPDLEVTGGPKGESDILIRKKGAKGPYNVLDPDTGFFSKDILNDATDVVGDVAQGVATTGAQAAAGTAGGLGTAAAGGIGAIPAAMAAGAATEAGGQGLRQILGKYAGMPNNLDGADLAADAAFGGLSPLVFGTGAGAKDVLKQGMKQGVEKGLPKWVVIQQAKQAAAQQSGLPMRALKSVAPKLGELASGIDQNILKNYARNFDEITGLEKTGITALAGKTGRDISEGMKAQRQAIGKDLNNVITQSGEGIDVTSAKNALRDKITELETKSLGTEAEKAQVQELKDMYQHFFQRPVQESAEASKVAVPNLDMMGKQMVSEAAPSEMKTVIRDIPDVLDADQALALQMRLKDPANLSRMTPNSTMARNAGKSLESQQMENAASDAVREISSTIDNTIEDSIMSKLDQASGKHMSTPRDLKNAYKTWAQYGRDFKNSFSSPDASYRTLSSIDSPGNVVKNEMLTNIDRQLGLDTMENAGKIQAHRVFNKPSWLPISSKGTVSTGRAVPLAGAGGLAGYYLSGNGDGNQGSKVAGAGIGAALATMAAGPQAMRMYIKNLNRASKLANSPWGSMVNRARMPLLEIGKNYLDEKEMK